MGSTTPDERALSLLKKMLTAHDTDIECSDCAESMDCLAELLMNGGKPDGALEVAEHHIQCCGCCRAEFNALLAILRMEQNPETTES
ncbi:MAG TPA: hypothetical protein PLD47_04180 [Aggregatilineales bacterium]|nr:hypothetical protein [Anaerolineales bacterium]HRE46899.1 hypothetical protein [Aggregatilineales bacterium]